MCANLLILPHSTDTKKVTSSALPNSPLPAASVLHLSYSHPSVAIHAVYPCLYPFLIRSQKAPSGAQAASGFQRASLLDPLLLCLTHVLVPSDPNPTNWQAHLTSRLKHFFSFFFPPPIFPWPGAAKNFGLFDFL
ncbi:Hypothetical predicted protein [Marmota monax]|uniref:Uncharacterized protein n=1 Tax=Marmota monax TaxID=9995 RepID=A0A5E4B4S0_MARMO|nr:hypothetical protein GHT09_016579 [Marmota monax]VTJ64345.1 Hypothetical predicted protein [Marmota monax]